LTAKPLASGALLAGVCKTPSNPPSPSGITFRAVLIGLVLVVLSCLWSIYNVHVLWSSAIDAQFFPVGAGSIFFALLLLNTLVKLFERAFKHAGNPALTGRELLIIMIMLLVSSTIPTRGLVGTWLGNIACPWYHTDAINQWTKYLLPYLPTWAIPPPNAANSLYEGVLSGRRAPWGEWMTPVLWWSGFFFALLAVNFFIVAILRRQWIEEERLSFPIAEVPVELVQGTDERGGVPRLLKNRLFWIGFAFPAVNIGVRIINFFIPAVPGDPLWYVIGTQNLPLGFPRIWLQFDWAVAGFAFLGKLDVLFSLWLFYWVYFFQSVVFTRIGVSAGPVETLFSGGDLITYQNLGSVFIMVAATLWLGRRHLKNVFLKALKKSHPYDDSKELVSSRTAVLGLIAGLLYMGLWLSKAGLSTSFILIFLPFYFVMILGVTRAVAESGMIWFGAPGMANLLTNAAFGVTAFHATTLAGIAMTWSFDMRAAFMPSVAHGAQMSELGGVRKRPISPLILLVCLITFVIAVAYTMHLCFRYGGRALDRSMFGAWGSQDPYVNSKRLVMARKSYIQAKADMETADGVIALTSQIRADGTLAPDLIEKLLLSQKALLGRPDVAQALAQTADLKAASNALTAFSVNEADNAPETQAMRDFIASLDKIKQWKNKYAAQDAEMQILVFLDTVKLVPPLPAKGIEQLGYVLEATAARIEDRIELDRTMAKNQTL